MTPRPALGHAERTDAELLALHVDGDADAFGELFARHRDRLWAVALRTMGNPEDAADGLQEGMIAAFRRAGSFRGDAAVTTWLHRVVVNACLDRLRAMKVRRTEALPDDLEDRADRGSLVSSTDAELDPAELAVADERRRTVLTALGTLTPDQRAALVLVDMEGYSVAEAAQMLDVAEGTVKSRCFRGRARLAPLLGVLAPPQRDVADTRNLPPTADVPTTGPPRAPPPAPS
ncbi:MULTISPECIES: RNA polymerase sigma factor SigM [Nocardioides]|uniref:RNA polymerase sigma factor SigM n=1 Tax=Nocardioides TaxID=1839 RepID=UPI00032F3D14|nr:MULTISPECIES: RNA polymerase sigma factor SigM [Nocardioides]EON22363.1 RNA polymerase sigma factor SigM [Nocardioides sp. CF8]